MQRNCSMPKKPKIPKDFLQRISTVKNKRALLVLKTIVEKGFVTTEDLNKAGYGHPPRAARDRKGVQVLLESSLFLGGDSSVLSQTVLLFFARPSYS